jgi:hypothetical protein
VLPTGTTTTQVHNCADWLTSIEHRESDGTLISQIDYEHDFIGNRTRAEHSPSGEVTCWSPAFRWLRCALPEAALWSAAAG